jgi:UV excision repair protein RAD23
LTFKSLKPPASYTLKVSPTDTIASIKSQLSSTHATAPPVDAQRLLVKGKALVDSKLLKEYNVQSGDTVNLMVKPGIKWDPSEPKEPEILQPKPVPAAETTLLGLAVGGETTSGKKRHGRAPSIVLSPSPSSDMPGAAPEKDIVLSVDSAADVPASATETLSTYQTIMTTPGFWENLLTFLK